MNEESKNETRIEYENDAGKFVFVETKKDLFTVDDSYFLAHCISSDFALGAGIAKEFEKRFDLKRQLHSCDYAFGCVSCAILIGRVFNLVTKISCWHKPTYSNMDRALLDMRRIVDNNCIKKIAMPRIGCGLDGLYWPAVKKSIINTFKDTDIEILICSL